MVRMSIGLTLAPFFNHLCLGQRSKLAHSSRVRSQLHNRPTSAQSLQKPRKCLANRYAAFNWKQTFAFSNFRLYFLCPEPAQRGPRTCHFRGVPV